MNIMRATGTDTTKLSLCNFPAACARSLVGDSRLRETLATWRQSFTYPAVADETVDARPWKLAQR